MNNEGLDQAATVADFKERMEGQKRKNWNAAFGSFLRAVTDGREDTDFPTPDDDDGQPAY